MDEKMAGKKGWRVRELKAFGPCEGFWRSEIRSGRLIARKCGRTVIILDSYLQAYLDQRCVAKATPEIDSDSVSSRTSLASSRR